MGHIWLPPQGQVGHALEITCLVALTWTKGQVTPTPKFALCDHLGCHVWSSCLGSDTVSTFHIESLLSSSQWAQ